MLKLIKADFKKVLYLPSYRNLLIATFVLSLLFGSIFLMTIGVTEGRPLTGLTSLEVIDVSFLGIDVVAIMMIIFAALFISKDITGGAVYTNLVMTPKRLKFFLSKLVFLSLLSIAMAFLVIAGIFVMDWAIMSMNSMGDLDLMNMTVLLKIVGSVLMVLVYGLLSGIGAFFVQTMAAGIIFSLGLMFLPALIRFFPDTVGDLLLPIFPETAIGSFVDLTGDSNHLLLALLILVLWLCASGVISYRQFKKKDY